MNPFIPRLGRLLAWELFLALAAVVEGAEDESETLFADRPPLRIEISLPDSQWDLLASGSMQQRVAKPSAKATVRADGRNYREVAVQLKGFSTFEPLEGRPSLTLDFNEHIRGQKFHGLTKISLNNSAQDPSRLHERLAREVMASAGLPVPRATHAIVSLNGRELDLYVLVEGYGANFLKRNFGDASGNFYEGGALRDVDRGLQWKSGRMPEDRSDLERLLRAVKEPDPELRWAALNNVLDLDRFLTLMAVETMLCHSDSYAMNRNNYRIYHDPKSDRLVFLPHGMDRILGSHRTDVNLPVVPPARGIVARAVLSTAEGRRRYVEQAEAVFTNVLQGQRWCERLRAMANRAPQAASDPVGWAAIEEPEAAAAERLCGKLEGRLDQVRIQFSQRSNWVSVPPVVSVSEIGPIPLTGWNWYPLRGQNSAANLASLANGGLRFELPESKGNPRTTLGCIVTLPGGNYRLLGRVRVVAPVSASANVALLRFQEGDRIATERHRLGSREVDWSFTVNRSPLGEEVHFLCEIAGPAGEVMLDFSELKLMRAESRPRGLRVLTSP